ncbi:hypothetical protein A2W32_05545 [candidate division WWE3 bacterium RBG_16_37_10]|uniref:Small ribosomal subunit protein bS20 n=1 Tax=candidate division WWE3 bacterium RBG_16_37_10 TaxID=1802610 RepID=A0A1F4USX4_UNCKA|nr:MAG: hypothetical protein A2W32_05545 [candidate division WWE3 bacterium RBG_16_37_10]
MLSYAGDMPNTMSAAKALRQSNKKRQHNLYWKKRISDVRKQISHLLQTKNLNADILNKELSLLAKALDKAAKEKVIHKNKANRLKSRYARKITVQLKKSSGEASKEASAPATTAAAGRKKSARAKS